MAAVLVCAVLLAACFGSDGGTDVGVTPDGGNQAGGGAQSFPDAGAATRDDAGNVARADAGAAGSGGLGGAGGTGGIPVSGGAGAPPSGGSGGSPDSCVGQVTGSTTVRPAIHFLVDASGSMCAAFGSATRWQAVRAALLDLNTGLIYRLQQTTAFGVVLYDGTVDALLALTAPSSSPGPACASAYTEVKGTGECPLLIDVPAAYNNAATIDASFPATELGGSTPTDRALAHLVDTLIAAGTESGARVVMITDGMPNDICVGGSGDPIAAQQSVLQQVDRAAAAGIETSVIGFADGDPVLEAFLTMLAMHGDPANPAAHAVLPATPESLTAELEILVGGNASCELTLDGMVQPGRECTGTVALGGRTLPCCVQLGDSYSCDGQSVANPDGWRLKAPDVIELLGGSCVEFLASPERQVRVAFPCDVSAPSP